MISTASGGFGSFVSIAEANGWTSSGQRGSHTQSALPHFAQKCRRAGDSVPRGELLSRTRARNTLTAFLPRTVSDAALPMMLIAYPPPPAVLRQIEQ